MVLLGLLKKNLPFLALDTQKFNKLIEIPKKIKISKVYIGAGYATEKLPCTVTLNAPTAKI